MYDFGQTFAIDPAGVLNSGVVFVTSVDLYFQAVPTVNQAASGIGSPGVRLYLCPTKDGVPDLAKAEKDSTARVEYSAIAVSATAATPTNFRFTYPVEIKTGTRYAFLVEFDGSDDGFALWTMIAGEQIIGTTTVATPHSAAVDGSYFKITNGQVLTSNPGICLTFRLNIAKFSPTDQTFKYQNRAYEKLTTLANTQVSSFIVGEQAYKNVAYSTGTLLINASSNAIIGTTTTFQTNFAVGDKIVISDNTAPNTNVRVVGTITDNTHLTLTERPTFSNAVGQFMKTAVGQVYILDGINNRIVLSDSNAVAGNNNYFFANNDVLKGSTSQASITVATVADFVANRAIPTFNFKFPSATYAKITANFANSTYWGNTSNEVTINNSQPVLNDTYPAIVSSASIAVNNTSHLFANSKSLNGSIELITTNPYASPYVRKQDLNFFTYNYQINADDSGEVGGTLTANSRYVSKPISLGTTQDAEDLRLFTTQWTPPNTYIRVYTRMICRNDYDNFLTKVWSPLEVVTPRSMVSNPANREDVFNVQWKIPYYPIYANGTPAETLLVTAGTITGTNTVINTTTDMSANVSAADMIRVYQPLVPNNYFIATVASANSTAIIMDTSIANISFQQSGLAVAKVANNYKRCAFVNIQNNNIVRYYDATMSPHDQYNVFALKIVMLSDNTWQGPALKNFQAIAVSA